MEETIADKYLEKVLIPDYKDKLLEFEKTERRRHFIKHGIKMENLEEIFTNTPNCNWETKWALIACELIIMKNKKLLEMLIGCEKSKPITVMRLRQMVGNDVFNDVHRIGCKELWTLLIHSRLIKPLISQK